MTYSLEQLKTVQECDNLLQVVSKEKDSLEFRQTSLSRQVESYKIRSLETSGELQVVEAEMAALQSLLDALPEGPTKQDNYAKFKKLEYKQFLLTSRSADYGSVALLDKEFDLSRTVKELEEADAFITTVETHKATLVAG
ncbi:hypothetical protein AB9P05_19735 [Roseivirga sp. BDSF3-8]|uniref:hypothetical protein n=1 Tax=Roseivirga sp. BDSF3-8 TaxID=3241598 RepID=UPI0035326B3D